jgi:hypothetical protein
MQEGHIMAGTFWYPCSIWEADKRSQGDLAAQTRNALRMLRVA